MHHRISFFVKVTGGIEKTILDLFDSWTHKWHYDENSANRHYYDGWRTNEAFAVNTKVIIPLYGAFSSWSGRMELDWDARRKILDIEKVFDYLDGGLTMDAQGAEKKLAQAVAGQQTRNIPLKYFTVTFYKKGTCHIVFTNLDILAKFNIFAAKSKKWLPPTFGRKQYKDMTPEEQKVAVSFTGSEEAYKKLVKRSDFFLAETYCSLTAAVGGIA